MIAIFSLKGVEVDLRNEEGRILKLNWQEARRLAEILEIVIENIDKHKIESGTIEKGGRNES